jgi:hypothetical protein
MVISQKNPEKEVGNRGSKSDLSISLLNFTPIKIYIKRDRGFFKKKIEVKGREPFYYFNNNKIIKNL